LCSSRAQTRQEVDAGQDFAAWLCLAGRLRLGRRSGSPRGTIRIGIVSHNPSRRATARADPEGVLVIGAMATIRGALSGPCCMTLWRALVGGFGLAVWVVMSRPAPARYHPTNWPEYNAALRRRGGLLVWLDRKMEWAAADLLRGRHSGLSVDQGARRLGSAADDREGREPAQNGGPGLAGARLLHSLPAAEDRQHPDPVPPLGGPAEPADRQHGREDAGRG
jgi:hypothetical protein